MSIRTLFMAFIFVAISGSQVFAKTVEKAPAPLSCEERIEKALREYDRYEKEDAVRMPAAEWQHMQEDMNAMHTQMRDMHMQMQEMHQMMRGMQNMPMQHQPKP